MTEERDTPDDLYPFAEMLVKQLKKQHQLRWNKHRMEDATQDLFLAGWQVWKDEGGIGLAKNRMVMWWQTLPRRLVGTDELAYR